MNASYITPFITSIQNVFSTMLQLDVVIDDPVLKTDYSSPHDVSGIIGMSGEVMGSVALSFPSATATRIVALFTGTDLKLGDPDFGDAIGELVNMVCGGAKANFPARKVSISIPSVVVGSGHQIARSREVPCVIIPCKTDCGDLAIEVAIQDAKAGAQTPAAAANA